jgi:hypothetical protein
VLLVGKLSDPQGAAVLAGRPVRFLPSESPELGRKAALAVSQARGDLLLFLEDDDRFLPSKLEEVVRTFDADPSLTYYHHSFRAIDDRGALLPAPHFRSSGRARIHRLGSVLLPADRPRGSLGKLAGTFPAYNTSSIAVRRALLVRWAEALARTDLLLDQFLFVAALCSPGSLRVDDAELTELRLHRGSASDAVDPGPDDLQRLCALAERNLAPRGRLRQMARASGDPNVVGYLEGSAATELTIAGLRGVRVGRAEMAVQLGRLVRRARTLEVRTYPGVIPLASLYLLSPRLARRAYRWAKRSERDRPSSV